MKFDPARFTLTQVAVFAVTTTSDAALRDAVQMMADVGADEVLLTPVHDDPEDVDRVADILA